MMVSAVLALAMLGAQPPIEAVRSAEAQRITALLAADFATVERLLGSELTYEHRQNLLPLLSS